jgi:hypothetical protein
MIMKVLETETRLDEPAKGFLAKATPLLHLQTGIK